SPIGTASSLSNLTTPSDDGSPTHAETNGQFGVGPFPLRKQSAHATQFRRKFFAELVQRDLLLHFGNGVQIALVRQRLDPIFSSVIFLAFGLNDSGFPPITPISDPVPGFFV